MRKENIPIKKLRRMCIKMEIDYCDLEFDEDFDTKRAEELGLFQLKLDLPKGLRVTGFGFDNKLLIRRQNE